MLRKLQKWWQFRQAVNAGFTGESRTPSCIRDVVVLPCWRRPEFLWHCLDNIARAQGGSELTVMIRPDTGASEENLEVARAFADRLPHIEIRYPCPSPYRRTKQSANVLLGYLHAAEEAKQLVFLIEEDVMIARDFFRWHREVRSSANRRIFCSIATMNPNRKLTLPNDVEAYYLSSADFCSIGVCFDKQILRTMVAPHVNMAYMRRPKKYVRGHFNNSAIGLGFVEQDGLIRRIQEQSVLPIAWPCVPRGFHAGFYGYNRPGGVRGELPHRIKMIADTIYSPESMQQVTGQQFDDSLSCDLQLPPWKALREISMPINSG